MKSIEQLKPSITTLSGDAYPVEKWDPQLCQTMDMVIDVNGLWHHNGDVIKRERLVLLFAKVLTKRDNIYYLITPAEKLEITVQDAPFVMVDFDVENPGKPNQLIWLISNVGDRVPLSAEYPLETRGSEQRPYIKLWRGLDALVSRSVYYQLIDLAEQQPQKNANELLISSSTQDFSLGQF